MAKGDNNYIQRLKTERDAAEKDLQTVFNMLVELETYLLSYKFHGPDNDYVYVSTDILPKISLIRHAACEGNF